MRRTWYATHREHGFNLLSHDRKITDSQHYWIECSASDRFWNRLHHWALATAAICSGSQRQETANDFRLRHAFHRPVDTTFCSRYWLSALRTLAGGDNCFYLYRHHRCHLDDGPAAAQTQGEIVTEKKAYPLRINADVLEAVQRWSDDELRSLNAQIEYVLREALRKNGRIKDNKVSTPLENSHDP
jgi:hypothetical protein